MTIYPTTLLAQLSAYRRGSTSLSSVTRFGKPPTLNSEIQSSPSILAKLFVVTVFGIETSSSPATTQQTQPCGLWYLREDSPDAEAMAHSVDSPVKQQLVDKVPKRFRGIKFGIQ